MTEQKHQQNYYSEAIRNMSNTLNKMITKEQEQQQRLESLESLLEENKKLKEALMDAIDWNWLDDDYPENLYNKYYAMAETEKNIEELSFTPYTSDDISDYLINQKKEEKEEKEFYPLELTKNDHVCLWSADGTYKWTIAYFHKTTEGYEVKFVLERPFDERVNWTHFEKLLRRGQKICNRKYKIQQDYQEYQ